METNMLDMAGGPFAKLLSFTEAAESGTKTKAPYAEQ